MAPSCIGTNARTLSAYTLDRVHCMNIESHYYVQKKEYCCMCVSITATIILLIRDKKNFHHGSQKNVTMQHL